MPRSAQSFKRGKPRFKPQPQLLIICEDSRSAKIYFEQAVVHFRASASVEVTHCGYTDPRGIVHHAIKRLKPFDEVVCVIDRDEHSNFEEASKLQRSHDNLKLFVSYPCFEFWLLLHFGLTRAPYQTARSVIQDLRTKPKMAPYTKGSTKGLFAELLPRLPQAMIHADTCLAQALAEKSMNPSTPIHQLMQRLIDLQQPVQVR
jgi:hypothetical protein